MTKNNFPLRMSESAYGHLFCYKKALVIEIGYPQICMCRVSSKIKIRAETHRHMITKEYLLYKHRCMCTYVVLKYIYQLRFLRFLAFIQSINKPFNTCPIMQSRIDEHIHNT